MDPHVLRLPCYCIVMRARLFLFIYLQHPALHVRVTTCSWSCQLPQATALPLCRQRQLAAPGTAWHPLARAFAVLDDVDLDNLLARGCPRGFEAVSKAGSQG